MQYKLPPLDALFAFEAAARLGSFAAAAEELNLTQSAVSHRVRSLESFLGYQLFDRFPRSLILNELGKAYLPSVQTAFVELTASTRGIFGATKREQVTVRLPVTHAVLWLPQYLDRFANDYPNIDVRVYSDIWSDQHVHTETDLEFRLGNGNWRDADSFLLLSEHMVPVCSAKHVKQFGLANNVSDLAQRARINSLGYDHLWQKLFQSEANIHHLQTNSIWVDTTLAAIEMACVGVRIALLQTSLLETPVVKKRLQIAYDTRISMQEGLYLVIPKSGDPLSKAAILFKDWITKELNN